MALSEKLQFLLTLDADSAIRGFQQVGKTADSSFNQAETRGQKFSAGFVKWGAAAAGFAGVAGVAIMEVAESASNLQEAMAATDVIFGSAGKAIGDFAQDAATSIGLSATAAHQGANTFGTFGKSAGLAGQDLANFSTDMVTLAGDFASFKNTSPEQAIEAIGAALRGESEPIRQYGILLDDATLKARAMSLGIYDGTGALTAQQKVLAAQAEILAQSSDAQGDFTRTSDGMANQQRILAAQFENAKAAIGEAFMPVVTGLVSLLNAGIPVIRKFGEGLEDMAFLAEQAFGFIADRFNDIANLPDNLWPDDINPFDSDDVRLIGSVSEELLTASKAIEQVQGAATHFGENDIVGPFLNAGDAIEYANAQLEKTRHFVEGAATGFAGFDEGFDIMRSGAETIGEFTDRVHAMQDAVIESLDSSIAMANAQRDAEDAFAKVNEVIADEDAALRDLAQALDDAKSAALDAAGAEIKFAEDTATAEGRTLTQTDKINILRGALQRQADQLNGPTRDALLALIGTIDAIPDAHPTHISTPGATTATSQVRDLDGWIHALRDKTVNVAVSGAGGAISAANAIAQSIRDIPTQRTITISVVGGQVPRFAGGGLVGSEGGIAGEAGPEHVKFPGGQQAFVTDDTFVPPGTLVTPMGSAHHGGAAAVGGYNGGGGNTINHININMPPGSNGNDVVRAIRKYERHNGPAWRR